MQYEESFYIIMRLAEHYNKKKYRTNEIKDESILMATSYYIFNKSLSLSHIYNYLNGKKGKIMSNLFKIGKKENDFLSKVYSSLKEHGDIKFIKLNKDFKNFLKNKEDYNFLTIIQYLLHKNKNKKNIDVIKEIEQKINYIELNYDKYKNNITLEQFLYAVKYNVEDNNKPYFDVSNILANKNYKDLISSV